MRLNLGLNPDEVMCHINNKLSRMQEDMLEGMIDAEDSGLSVAVNAAMNGHAFTDIMFRAEGYKYCNTACFYRLIYTRADNMISYDLADSMIDFGGSVVIIDEPDKFLERINLAVCREGYKYLCGSVEYRPEMKDGIKSDVSERHHVLLESSELVDVKISSIKRDCFVKSEKYEDQREWRIILYRGVQETKAYTLSVGSLKDIAHRVEAQDLTGELERLFVSGRIRPCRTGFYGNTDRKEINHLFCELGANKARMFVAAG